MMNVMWLSLYEWQLNVNDRELNDKAENANDLYWASFSFMLWLE